MADNKKKSTSGKGRSKAAYRSGRTIGRTHMLLIAMIAGYAVIVGALAW